MHVCPSAATLGFCTLVSLASTSSSLRCSTKRRPPCAVRVEENIGFLTLLICYCRCGNVLHHRTPEHSWVYVSLGNYSPIKSCRSLLHHKTAGRTWRSSETFFFFVKIPAASDTLWQYPVPHYSADICAGRATKSVQALYSKLAFMLLYDNFW